MKEKIGGFAAWISEEQLRRFLSEAYARGGEDRDQRARGQVVDDIVRLWVMNELRAIE